jgi:hypothetical protein
MNRIGVSEKIVMKRRRSTLLNESIITLTQQLRGNDVNMFIFGSTSEGSTTKGLESDTDCLNSLNTFNVIQDWSEWEYSKHNLLMIQDENVSPGYCFLQELRNDVPLPHVLKMNVYSYRDRLGKILLKNTLLNAAGNSAMRHGPAFTEQDIPGIYDRDLVFAFPCHLRPVQAGHWLNQHREEHWPTNDMIQYCRNMRCFVVGVGKKGNENEAFEWRISTSIAERCLMFNLNITQIRCYVLMKMILKTFITQMFPDSISSFMCKTVLLHCISFTRSDAWNENTLFCCLSFCLSTLYNCVQNEYCPHFFITHNNLMSGRFSSEAKPLILETLRYVIESNGRVLLQIECDNYGSYLQSSFYCFLPINVQFIPTHIAGHLLRSTAQSVSACVIILLDEIIYDLSPRHTVQKLLTFMLHHHYDKFTNIYRKAYRLITRHLCSTLGSILASLNIYQQDHLTYKIALSIMLLGLDYNEASCKLKVASMFYCTGDTERTELILKNIEECYDLSVVEPVCGCYNFKKVMSRESFNRLCSEFNEECTLLKLITASCVCFIRCEMNCCPFEFQHEMFRSTQEELAYRSKDDDWMGMAVVDSLTYLYFLQYKTYSLLGKQDDKQRALSNIARTIFVEPNLGHRETALNLLGQCMEQEYRKYDALKCFLVSLKIRSRHNAAKFHILRLLASCHYSH